MPVARNAIIVSDWWSVDAKFTAPTVPELTAVLFLCAGETGSDACMASAISLLLPALQELLQMLPNIASRDAGARSADLNTQQVDRQLLGQLICGMREDLNHVNSHMAQTVFRLSAAASHSSSVRRVEFLPQPSRTTSASLKTFWKRMASAEDLQRQRTETLG